jgi:hypothetical protein
MVYYDTLKISMATPPISNSMPSGLLICSPHGRFFFAAITAPQRQHPAEAARADGKHQQHQRPAAADAKQSVMRGIDQRASRRMHR